MINDLIFNGKSLRNIGFVVSHFPIHSVAKRDIEFKSVLGRSGDVIVDNQRFHNVDMPPYEINTYDLRWMNNKDKLERALIDWLMTGDGSYKVLEDKTKPGYFAYAVCTEIGEISTNHLDGYLATSINFNRQPFWFSHAGQKAIEWSGSTSQHIVNPESYTALPIITISGSGYMILTVNGVDYNIRLTETVPTITLDCEKMHAYCGSTDADSYISSDYFPSLRTGTNHIRVWTNRGATIGACSLIPRWRRL